MAAKGAEAEDLRRKVPIEGGGDADVLKEFYRLRALPAKEQSDVGSAG